MTVDENLGETAAARDHKPSFAKVSWGAGKGPYIFAFESSCDALYVECNAHEFKAMKASDLIKNHKTVPIWDGGGKDPESVNKCKKLDLSKFLKKNKKA